MNLRYDICDISKFEYRNLRKKVTVMVLGLTRSCNGGVTGMAMLDGLVASKNRMQYINTVEPRLKVKKWYYFLVNPKKDRFLNTLQNMDL